MNFRHPFIAGFAVSCLLWVGCAAVTYRHYGLSLPDACYDQGTLLGVMGDSGWPDIPFSQCKPDAVVKGKCMIQLESDYFSKDAELLKCRSDLVTCQSGNSASRQ